MTPSHISQQLPIVPQRGPAPGPLSPPILRQSHWVARLPLSLQSRQILNSLFRFSLRSCWDSTPIPPSLASSPSNLPEFKVRGPRPRGTLRSECLFSLMKMTRARVTCPQPLPALLSARIFLPKVPLSRPSLAFAAMVPILCPQPFTPHSCLPGVTMLTETLNPNVSSHRHSLQEKDVLLV